MTQERILSLKVGGIICGVSWHSTKQLYEYINARVAEEKGGHNCAKLVLINVNLQDILDAPDADAKGAVIVDAAIRAEKAGADFVALGSNGLHQYAERVEKAIRIPFIHIADVTADAITAAGYQTVGLLGVKETMEQGFYKDRLAKRGLRVLIPERPERDFINTVLFEETGVGIVKESSKQAFYRIAGQLAQNGAECIILGCTEIEMLMKQEETNMPLFDTTALYAEKIAQLCCSDQ